MSTDGDGFDPLRRELCPDGACIGIIGPDGFCRECGMPGLGVGLDPRTRGQRPREEVEAELEANIVANDVPAAPDDFDSRVLCPDGTCIGLIGTDGRCRKCGCLGPAKSASASGTSPDASDWDSDSDDSHETDDSLDDSLDDPDDSHDDADDSDNDSRNGERRPHSRP